MVNQDIGPSPVIVALLLISVLVLAFVPAGSSRGAGAYGACVAVGLLLSWTLLAWNPWVNRLTLGSLLLLTPIVGVAATALEASSRRVASVLVMGLLALSVAWGAAVMLFDQTNRLIPLGLLPMRAGARDAGYWNTSWDDLRFRLAVPHDEFPFKTIADIVWPEGIERIGIDARMGNVAIYPLLALLPDRHFEYVGDTVLKDRIAAPRFEPQAILEGMSVDDVKQLGAGGTTRGRILYGPVTAGGEVFLLYRAP